MLQQQKGNNPHGGTLCGKTCRCPAALAPLRGGEASYPQGNPYPPCLLLYTDSSTEQSLCLAVVILQTGMCHTQELNYMSAVARTPAALPTMWTSKYSMFSCFVLCRMAWHCTLKRFCAAACDEIRSPHLTTSVTDAFGAKVWRVCSDTVSMLRVQW